MTATFDSARLLQETRARFPRLSEATLRPIEKGGSDRRFYRIGSRGGDSLVLVQYNLERVENRHYVQLALFLAEHKIRAPKILSHDAEAGLIWVEDLGERDLWGYRNESWSVRRPLYESAINAAGRLHALSASAAEEIRVLLAPAFEADLYLWEQQYFLENCLGRHFGLDQQLRAELSGLPALRKIAARLADLPRVLIHRDFQSQNIIIREGEAYLIDFQGMRLGLAEYDLASLVFDPYVELSAAERDQLIQFSGKASAELVRLCALQRLMQALGAFGYLGLVKGNRAFLAHIPAAVRSLREVIGQIPGLEKLIKALDDLELNAEE